MLNSEHSHHGQPHARIVRKLSAYVDGELSRAQEEEIRTHLRECAACRAAWEEIRQGARLGRELEPSDVPDTVWPSVAREIAETRERRSRMWRPRIPLPAFGWHAANTRTRFVVLAAAAVLALAVVGRLPWVTDTSVSADDIANRSDRRVAELLQPDHVLYRRWHHHRRSHTPSGITTKRAAVLHTWVDGSNIRRAVSRLYSHDGRLFSSSFEGEDPRDDRLLVYYTPENPDGPYRGVLVQGYTPADRQAAINRLPAEDQERLRQYFGPSYRTPVVGEVRFNRQLIQEPAGSGSTVLPRIRESLRRAHYNGEPVAIIRTTDPVRPWGEIVKDGGAVTSLARIDSTRYISLKTYLALRVQMEVLIEDGRRLELTSELAEIRSIPRSELPQDPFRLDVPPGTPTRRATPDEALLSFAGALRRIAAGGTTTMPAPASTPAPAPAQR